MVPIRKGDGTGLAAKGYSQVRKGDGTVLWDAIPDSGGDHQYNYDEGSGTTVGDSIGSLDAAFNQLSWGTGAGAGDTFGLLDGTDDYGDLGTNSAFNHFTDEQNGTVFAWVRCDDVAGLNAVISSASLSDEVGISLEVRDGGDVRALVTVGTTGEQAQAFPANLITEGVWTPIAFTIDAGTLKLYTGDPLTEQATDSTASSTTSNHTGNMNFGRRPTSNDFYYTGGLDLMWTDSVARTQSELQSFVDDSSEFYA